MHKIEEFQNLLRQSVSDCRVKKIYRFSLAVTRILIVVGIGVLLNGCKTDVIIPDDSSPLKITGVSIPSSIDVAINEDLVITGKGFEAGDQIRFTLLLDASREYTVSVKSVTDQNVTFSVPAGIASGSYQIAVLRGTESLLLGSLILNIVVDSTLPDVAGMTIKGVVFCDGVGIPDVVVSDGFEVTTTDKDGIYYLPSLKKNGYVFISIPGNYEVANVNNLPQFFKRLSGGSTVEQKDFSLFRVDNSKHVVLAMADWHLANRNDDLAQFTSGFLTDVNATIRNYRATGTKVYGLTLGDMSWDAYWYSNLFALPEYLTQMYKIDCTMFNLIGNHDNDPYAASDWTAESKFKSIVGPTYYSFNLGNVHYIVLDDIQYMNTGGSEGVMGDRNYNGVIVSDQMEWLKKDLATVEDKNTPIVIALHIPVHSNPTIDSNGNLVRKVGLSNGAAFLSALQGFTKVHILSGHTHINYTVEASESITEHNTAAVCATWWWTGKNGYAGNHICTDGSPGGYGVWEMQGTDIEWHYKSIGYDRNYQFRSYDLNTVHITAANYAPNSTDTALAEYAGVYAESNSENEILINVWGYDRSWTLDVKENGQSLAITRVYGKDPLHIISYEAKRLNAGAVPTSSFVTGNTAHLFKVKASSPTSTIVITATDGFGNVSTETMSRPKAFTFLMK